MSWHFLPEAAGLFGLPPSSVIESSAPSKSKRSNDRCYSQGSEMAHSLCFRCGTTSPHSKASLGVEKWILSLVGFPAPTSASPERAQGSTARSPGFGAKWPASSPRCSRVSSSWRTCVPLFPEDSTEFSATWPTSGSMRSGIVFERPTWAHRTSESGSSSWPTAQAHDCRGGKTPEQVAAMRAKGHGVRNLNEEAAQWTTPTSWPTARATDGTKGGPNQAGSKGDLMLPSAAAQWPTPVANDDNKSPEAHLAMKARMKGGPRQTITSLQVLVQQWPTPTAGDSNSSGAAGYSIASGRHSGTTLTDAAVRGRQAPTTAPNGQPTSGKAVLNPQFVEALMGWPIGASGLQPLATGGSRKWLRSHGGLSGAESMSEAAFFGGRT